MEVLSTIMNRITRAMNDIRNMIDHRNVTYVIESIIYDIKSAMNGIKSVGDVKWSVKDALQVP